MLISIFKCLTSSFVLSYKVVWSLFTVVFFVGFLDLFVKYINLTLNKYLKILNALQSFVFFFMKFICYV